MARHPDFEPFKLFAWIDRNNNGEVGPIELHEFMSGQYMHATMEDCDDFITEYDGTQNRRLDFDEFCQLVLPSANQSLRHIATSRRYSPYFQSDKPIPYEVLSLTTRLMDKELQLQRTRNDQKRELERCPDFVKHRSFDQISRGFHSIGMPELITYLERNGFFPRREDVEAILRRCDHDATRMISYEEFASMTSFMALTGGAASGAENGEPMSGGELGGFKGDEGSEELRQGPAEESNTLADKIGAALISKVEDKLVEEEEQKETSAKKNSATKTSSA